MAAIAAHVHLPTTHATARQPLPSHPPHRANTTDEISEGLRYTLQTDSKYTLMVSGTGHAGTRHDRQLHATAGRLMHAACSSIANGPWHACRRRRSHAPPSQPLTNAGMEAAIANLLEPGEKIVVGNAGIWGTRVADLAQRYGGDVVELKAEAGKSFSLAELTKALETHKPAVLFLCQVGRRVGWPVGRQQLLELGATAAAVSSVLSQPVPLPPSSTKPQGESSTGVHQSLAGLSNVCKRTGTLLLVDTVCSLGGVPFFFDKASGAATVWLVLLRQHPISNLNHPPSSHL